MNKKIQTALKTNPDSYSIEFAHIYTDEKVDSNHYESAKIMQKLLKSAGPKSTSVVLIDDYNAETDGFSIDAFLELLAEKGASPDFYALESSLVPPAKILLSSIDKPKIFRMYSSYIERKNFYPCSLLTAAWYLIRLGYLDDKSVIQVNNSRLSAKNAVADRLINILPTSFSDVEKDAHQLIGHSTFRNARFKIEPILFKELSPVRAGFTPELV